MRTLPFLRLIAFSALGCLLPAVSTAQSPIYLRSIGSFGFGLGNLYNPSGVAVDDSGFVFITDLQPDLVKKFTDTGSYLAQWGGQGSGPGQFYGPLGIAVGPDGHIFVTDLGNQRIQEFSSSGAYIAQWPTLSQPWGIAVDAVGNKYVTEAMVGVYSPSGQSLATWRPGGTPRGVALDRHGHNFIGCGYPIDAVEERTASGVLVRTWGASGTGNGQFNTPGGLVVDSQDRVYVADSFNHRVEAFSSTGEFLFAWGSYGIGPGQFSTPIGLAVDRHDNIYVVDRDNSRIEVFGPGPVPVVQRTWGHLKSLYR